MRRALFVGGKNMEEYIKKGKILDLITEQRKFYDEEKKKETDAIALYMLCGSDNALVGIEDGVNDIEPDDVAPVSHAKFMMASRGYVCSKCLYEPMMKTDNEGYYLKWPKYCPHCGAKMDLE